MNARRVHHRRRQTRSSRHPRPARPVGDVSYPLPDHEFFGRLAVNKRSFAAVVVLALVAAGPLLAHHSLAGVYDLKKIERATGVVQKFAFTNPHGALHISIKNAQGEAKLWQL